MRSCGGKVVMSSPKNRTVPAVGMKSPVMALNKVVLPAPLVPRMARRSPARIVRSMPSSATKAPKLRRTPRSSRAFAAPARAILWTASLTNGPESANLLAVRVVARYRTQRHELGLVHPHQLVHLGDDLDHFVVELAVASQRHFGQEDVG